MTKIDTKSNTIYAIKGEPITLPFKIKDYTFSKGDILNFNVYDRQGYNYPPIITKECEVEEETDTGYIELSTEETDNFYKANKPISYWYQITLNNENVVLGYDFNGPKEIVIYPRGTTIESEVSEDE